MSKMKFMAIAAATSALAITGVTLGASPMRSIVAQADIPVKDTFTHSLVLKDKYAFSADKKGFIVSQTTQELTMKWVDNDYTKFYIMSNELYLHNDSGTDLSFSSEPTFWTAFNPYQLSPINNSKRALIYRGGEFDIIKSYAVSNIGGEYSSLSLNIDYGVWTAGNCAAREGAFADSCVQFLSQPSVAPEQSSSQPSESSTPSTPSSTVSTGWETATMIAGTKGSACTVNNVDGIKVGTSSVGGDMKITVPSGSTQLSFYAAAWKGVNGLSLNLSGATCVPASVALTADDGISNNSPFTLSGNVEDYLFTIDLSDIEQETFIVLTSSIAKRFVVWGARYYK